jgi:DHA3 family multidrug efflux protein-like MFS transporter
MKTFYQILGNSVAAGITNMTVWFGLTYFLYLSTLSVLVTSWLSGIYLVTTVVTGFWFGGIVDHHHKKAVMIWSGMISLTAYTLAMMVYIAAPAGAFATISSYYVWALIGVVIVGVIAGNLRNIALPTLVTILVPEKNREKANGLVGTATGVAFLITSVISGFLVGTFGMWLVLGVGIVLGVLTLLHLVFVRIDEKKIVHLSGQSRKVDIKGTLKVVLAIPGLMALILFATINNFLGGVFMSLMDAYGLSLVSVEVWGVIWGALSIAFIVGGLVIARFGLGGKPVRALMAANAIIWLVSMLFTAYPSIVLLCIGSFIYLAVVPYIEASEQTIMQKLVPQSRQGRVFGLAQSVEQAAAPITAFAIGPLAQFFFIPFMTDGAGAKYLGPILGVGPARGIALVFVIAGILGLLLTLLAWKSKYYHELADHYQDNV